MNNEGEERERAEGGSATLLTPGGIRSRTFSVSVDNNTWHQQLLNNNDSYYDDDRSRSGTLSSDHSSSTVSRSLFGFSNFRKSLKSSQRKASGGGTHSKLSASKSDSNALRLKSSEPEPEPDFLYEEGRKYLVHYDCQSTMFDPLRIKQQIPDILSCKTRNFTTGASQASGGAVSREADDLAGTDAGDVRHNRLLQSCPFFRNELGDEPQRLVFMCAQNNQPSTDRTIIDQCRKMARQVSVTDAAMSLQSFSTPFNVIMLESPPSINDSASDTSLNPGSPFSPDGTSGGGSGRFSFSEPGYADMTDYDDLFSTYTLEHIDYGSQFYRKLFLAKGEHVNLVGCDPEFGPVAISLRRELAGESDLLDVANPANSTTETAGTGNHNVQYYVIRIIIRFVELTTLRASVLEEVTWTGGGKGAPPSLLPPTRRIPVEELLRITCPGLSSSCLRVANSDSAAAVRETLLLVDEQLFMMQYKVGIILCKPGQQTEEDLYSNNESTPAFDEFLALLGDVVELKGFDRYRAQLDNKNGTTGRKSLYTRYLNNEIMFHVSTFLPNEADHQHLMRKRHIGNDIVTIIFCEPGCEPFSPKMMRSQYQHVFIVVSVQNPNSKRTTYKVAVARSKDVPPFGPALPPDATFKKNSKFANFLKAKVINGENASHKSCKFRQMATRTRKGYLESLVKEHSTSQTVDGDGNSKISMFVPWKKSKSKLVGDSHRVARGGVTWQVKVSDFCMCAETECVLTISSQTIVLMEQDSSQVIFHAPTQSVIAFSKIDHGVKIFFGGLEYIEMRFVGRVGRDGRETPSPASRVSAAIERLLLVTPGDLTEEVLLRRDERGQLGFHIQPDGTVHQVSQYGFAWQAGLKPNSRILEICKISMVCMTAEERLDMLRNSKPVHIVVVSPDSEGRPRLGAPLSTSRGGYLPPPVRDTGSFRNIQEQFGNMPVSSIYENAKRKRNSPTNKPTNGSADPFSNQNAPPSQSTISNQEVPFYVPQPSTNTQKSAVYSGNGSNADARPPLNESLPPNSSSKRPSVNHRRSVTEHHMHPPPQMQPSPFSGLTARHRQMAHSTPQLDVIGNDSSSDVIAFADDTSSSSSSRGTHSSRGERGGDSMSHAQYATPPTSWMGRKSSAPSTTLSSHNIWRPSSGRGDPGGGSVTHSNTSTALVTQVESSAPSMSSSVPRSSSCLKDNLAKLIGDIEKPSSANFYLGMGPAAGDSEDSQQQPATYPLSSRQQSSYNLASPDTSNHRDSVDMARHPLDQQWKGLVEKARSSSLEKGVNGEIDQSPDTLAQQLELTISLLNQERRENAILRQQNEALRAENTKLRNSANLARTNMSNFLDEF